MVIVREASDESRITKLHLLSFPILKLRNLLVKPTYQELYQDFLVPVENTRFVPHLVAVLVVKFSETLVSVFELGFLDLLWLPL